MIDTSSDYGTHRDRKEGELPCEVNCGSGDEEGEKREKTERERAYPRTADLNRRTSPTSRTM